MSWIMFPDLKPDEIADYREYTLIQLKLDRARIMSQIEQLYQQLSEVTMKINNQKELIKLHEQLKEE